MSLSFRGCSPKQQVFAPQNEGSAATDSLESTIAQQRLQPASYRQYATRVAAWSTLSEMNLNR